MWKSELRFLQSDMIQKIDYFSLHSLFCHVRIHNVNEMQPRVNNLSDTTPFYLIVYISNKWKLSFRKLSRVLITNLA